MNKVQLKNLSESKQGNKNQITNSVNKSIYTLYMFIDYLKEIINCTFV